VEGLYNGRFRYEVAFRPRCSIGRLLDAAALLGVFIAVKALELPISSGRDKLIICNRFSGPMLAFRCCLFFFGEYVSNRGWVKIMIVLYIHVCSS
jgi:hypothetical protein